MAHKILALVLARKGSSRLRNKNLLKLKGKPLIQWTLDKLNKKNIKKLFVDVLVSTDSTKIQNMAKKYQFLCPWLRPKKLSGRLSTSEASALHAINWYEKNIQKINGLFLFSFIKVNKLQLLTPSPSTLSIKYQCGNTFKV